GESEVVCRTGTLWAETEPLKALTAFQQAQRLAQQVGNPLTEARALEGAARCQLRLGERRTALFTIRRALSIYREIGAAEAESADAYRAELERKLPEPGVTHQQKRK
ncbi:hypothetical protein ACFU9Y_22745, partial [Streptomyces sp. NPDC057621]|uniref:hypothetical protein n=1 Tax=Streptomyces sp. NPDC057621 TaxID=3346186 RepID=UPI00367885DF